MWCIWASTTFAQTPVGLAPVPRPVFTQNGAPLVNGCLFSFAAGTSTPLATFADSSGSVSNPNPVILDANGTPSVSGNEVGIYLSSANYKFQLKAFGGTNCASGASVWTADNINAASFLNLPNSWTATQSFNAGAGNSDIVAGNFNGIRIVDGIKFVTPQAAIADCPTADCWVLVKPGTYSAPTNMGRSHLHVLGYNPGVPATTIAAATNLVWGTPPADNKVIFTSATGTTISGVWDTTIEGVTFDCLGNNVNCLVLQNGVFESTFGSEASPITIQNSGTGAALTMNGGASAGQSVVKNLINANIFNAGKGIVLTATAPGVSANNVFGIVHIQSISIRGIEFTQNADSNTFRWTFMSGLANAAQAIAFNTATPAVDVDADANVFGFCLCADVQNPGSYTGTLVQVNKSFGNAINNWEIGPGIQTAGGVELALANAPTFAYTITEDFTAAVNNGNSGVGGNLLLGGQVRNFANNATMGLTLKKGSGAGNYTSASTTLTPVDSTNLCYTVTIPLGWKLSVAASGLANTATAAVQVNVALTDNAACATANAGLLNTSSFIGTSTAVASPFALNWVIAGDGASHNIALQYSTSNGADVATISNPSATLVPTMVFTLMPSN